MLAVSRAPYRGRSTPVNAWWGSFDLAVSLSGEPAKPPAEDFIMRNNLHAARTRPVAPPGSSVGAALPAQGAARGPASHRRPRARVLSRSTVSPIPASRDAENELYDRGCDLVEVAAAIRRAAAAREARRAVPALLGCVEAAVAELRAASALFTASSIEGGAPEDHAMAPRAERMERGLANL